MLCLGNAILRIVVGRELFHVRLQLGDFGLLLRKRRLKFIGMFKLRRLFRLFAFAFFGSKTRFQLCNTSIALSGFRLSILLGLGNGKLYRLGILLLQHAFSLSYFLVEFDSAHLTQDIGETALVYLEHLSAVRAFYFVHA